MIDGRQLLSDLQPLRRRLEDDLRERSDQVAELGDHLRREWQDARQRERTAQAYEAWRDDALAQATVMWILGCVFVRFLEDNSLVGPPRLAGPEDRLRLARDQHTLYFQQRPLQSDREYLYSVFEAVAALPGAEALFDRRHNPVWTIGISGDAATALLEFWQRIDPATGALVHDFTDAEWRTRFLGDLYQDLSESARKKYALLQTPDFVLRFILDRTLTPAIDEFGFREVRLIDPACGSGHFLLEAFERLFRQWSEHEPGRNPRELAQRALAQVSGVDLNPFAVAIARFRLLLAALRASGITRLADAPAFSIDLAAGDSLLHGPRPGPQGARQMYLDSEHDPVGHVYATEDAADLRRILGRRYHVVVGNPPYITPKDPALNKAYRESFGSCHMKYSLAVPFTERFFDLALAPENGHVQPAGHVGMITANSFMKREFGRKLVEEYIPRWDLTHVVDTSGAYIPGHGTPTVILFGRHRKPIESTVRAVLGIRGEPTTPDDPATGHVWTAILGQINLPGSTSEFVSVSDQTPLSIAFAFVATHNHFVLDRGGKVFNRSAPVIKLAADATEDDHLSLLGLLNSSTACFWMKQTGQTKGSSGIGRGVYDEKWEFFYEFTAAGLEQLPVPENLKALLSCGRALDGDGRLSSDNLAGIPYRQGSELAVAATAADQLRRQMISLQEELDWKVYSLWQLSSGELSSRSSELVPIDFGERAFEIVIARRIATGDLATAWFERHRSTPITDLPCHWPEEYKRVVERRIQEIESNPQIALIEQPEYKRRWNVERWESQVARALRQWLLDRLEAKEYFPDVALTSVARLADRARRDEDFMGVAAVYRGQDGFDVSKLVAELVESEAVPFLPVLRYKPSGLRKREAWESTWELQRREDAIDARTSLPEGHPDRLSEDEAKRLKEADIGPIPVPPKYTSADFLSSTFWRLRGKLDVPKERFISYPYCQRDADPTLVIGWGGWDHLQQPRALATYYVHMKESEGWTAERLAPLLAGLLELLSWLKQ